MEISELEQLIEMLRESNVGELTLRQGGERVTIRKAARSAPPSVSLVRLDEEYDYPSRYGEVMDDESSGYDEEQVSTVLVTAPLVGVFGHVKPFVGLNARVTEGQIVGRIEAMKITTEVTAPASGTIVDVFIEDGHPVEYGQALFEIRAD